MLKSDHNRELRKKVMVVGGGGMQANTDMYIVQSHKFCTKLALFLSQSKCGVSCLPPFRHI